MICIIDLRLLYAVLIEIKKEEKICRKVFGKLMVVLTVAVCRHTINFSTGHAMHPMNPILPRRRVRAQIRL
jgi:hypothetical protein